ncbi:trypsin-like peptidase domain-containing protein [Nonomuraea turkmeniaca]|nr:trypsin-like peptidase domain-containing protein [Nonomuraea turkmeniaca]
MTIVIRHAATDHSKPDAEPVDLDDCATQRNLSAQGRADARTIGHAFRRSGMRVGAVWTSPYCRSRDTAELAFGRAEVVHGLERLYPQPDQQAQQRLNELIRRQAPQTGEPNLVIVSHGVYPSILSPAAPIAEGEAALYTRRGDRFALLARVTPAQWAAYRSPAIPAARSVVTLPAGAAFRVAVPGILVTNAHLVAGVDQIAVVLPDGTRRTAQVLGRRQDVDIAALKLDGTALPPLHSGLGLGRARVGDPVLAIGAAGAVTQGTIQDLDHPVTLPGGTRIPAIRTDALLPPGGPGGPLLDARGTVLGVLTTIPAVPEAVAIPVDVARAAALDIVDNPGPQ